MCGFCLIIGGIPIQNHSFDQFNFFQSYLCKNNTALNQHIISNKLTLSETINPIEISKHLIKRGPDSLVTHSIDLFKTNYKIAALKQLRKQLIVPQGQALGMQSILHLRGQNSYIPNVPGSYFLYNGQIWNTGSLTGFQKDQNDAKWFHQTLIQCKGSKQKILQILKEIRGDYSFIMLEGNQIFVGKDYFGKRSLLLGMGQNYLAFSSVPIQGCAQSQQNQEQKQKEKEKEKDQNEEQNQINWRAKDQNQWLISKDKKLFQIPPNSLIKIDIKDNRMAWSCNKIIQTQIKSIQKCLSSDQQNIKGCIKKLLIESVKEMTKNIIDLGNKQKSQSKVAVLFSGGLDSALIARMLDLTLPQSQQIDLVNLAFRNDAPDRQSAKICYEQLHMLNPNRKYNLILLDRTINELQQIEKQLMYSIYPKTTKMDFNIAAALYLVSNAKPRIVMSGLGADEMFGGYSRYKIAYKRSGFGQLQNQMVFDMERLWIRNLGRDDRAIGSQGKQVRYPFLYYLLWQYLRAIEIRDITQGNGQKKLLRKIAQDFGLQKSSTFKKKTIQIGTRLTKLLNGKSFGNNKKSNKGNYENQ